MIIIGDTYLGGCVGPTTTTSSIRTGVHWIHILQSTLESAVFEGFIIDTFALLKKILYEESLFILCFTALEICFNIDFGLLKSIFM